MTQLWHSPLPSSVRSAQPADDTSPLKGIWIQWKTLTRAEQVVCVGIVLIPLWWILGWTWFLFALLVGIAIHDLLHHGSLRLKRPTLETIALLAFGFYFFINSNLKTAALSPSSLGLPISLWISGGLALWYIQSNNIRVRPQVMAWAFSISIVQMIMFWLVVHFVLSEPSYTPYRSLFALLTDKGEQFIRGAGNANYLSPYAPDDKGLGGFTRFSFFFSHASTCAMLVGFAALLSLDLKNRTWTICMMSACLFLLFLTQTRSAWLAFPVVLTARYFSTRSKVVLFALIAAISFAALSFPPITNLFDNYTEAIQATNNLRRDSSEVRGLIYQRTLERIPEELLLGHGINGPTVLPGFDAGRIGSHSFYLGTLLYKSGVLGTTTFLIFLAAFFTWLTKTKTDRPICCFLVLLYIGLNLLVEEAETVTMLLVLLCTLLRESEIVPTRGLRNE
jgi:O-Antigen ligase